MIGLFNSDGREALAFRGWYICVSLPVFPAKLCLAAQPLLDGNSLQPLTMNGMCFEEIGPTDGRYGFVAF